MATFRRFTGGIDLDHVECLQADPLVEIADSILEHADPAFVSVGDGIVTFHCFNGDITYGLREYDDLRETWLGVRSGVTEDDLDDLGAHTREG